MSKHIKEKPVHLTSDDFITQCQELFSTTTKVWRREFMELTGVEPSTVTRYINGQIPIPLTVANLLHAVATLKYYKDDYRETFEIGEQT